MKKLRKTLAGLMALLMAVTGLAGCGGGTEGQGGQSPKDGKGNSTDIAISYWNSGLGTEWLDAIIKAFEEEHPEYHVFYNATASESAVVSALGIEDVDTNDLYLGTRTEKTEYLEPLDSLLELTLKGDSKKLGEKFDSRYLQLEKSSDGHYYGLTYGGGILGIVYNKEMFEKAGIKEIPRTTDELAAVCDKLYNNDMTALIHFKPAGYWDYLTEVWMSQYDGMDYYLNNLYGCTDEEGNSPSKSVFTKKDGRYHTLQAYEKFMTPEYVLSGSNTYDHVTSQTMFLNGSAAMMFSGSWMVNEMESTGVQDKFTMMRIPVLSAITERLSTVKGDTALRKLVSAIDSVADGKKRVEDYATEGGYDIDGTVVTQEDWDIVYEARMSVAVNYSGEPAFIPSYSDNKEGAMEFLKFFYSDKGYKIYLDALHIPLPMELSEGKVDDSAWTSFEKGQLELMDSAVNFVSKYNGSKHKIYTAGGADPFCGVSYINYMCSKNSTDRLTTDEVWGKMMDVVENKYESSWLANIK